MSKTRNFYLRAEIDGRTSDLGAGPTAPDGGMYVELMMRSDDRPVNVLLVSCTAYEDGELRVKISLPFLPDDVKVDVEVDTGIPDADAALETLKPLRLGDITIRSQR